MPRRAGEGKRKRKRLRRERDRAQARAQAQTQGRAQDHTRNHQSGSRADRRARQRRSGSRGFPALAEPLRSFRELGRRCGELEPELEPVVDAVVDDNDRKKVVAVFVGSTEIDLEGAALERANDELVTAAGFPVEIEEIEGPRARVRVAFELRDELLEQDVETLAELEGAI